MVTVNSCNMMAGSHGHAAAGWSLSAGLASPAPGEIHLWRLDLRDGGNSWQELCAVCSPQERARASRFHCLRDRLAFVLCRAALRQILAGYLDVDPAAVLFSADPHGKPQLGEPLSAAGLRFNVSHSGLMGLIAVGRDRDVGVDIELVRPVEDAAAIARLYFSPREAACLAGLSASQAAEQFLSIWTRKEAYCKARGGGLFMPFARFCVATQDGAVVACRAPGCPAGREHAWKLEQLRFAEPGAGETYVGALAGQGPAWRTVLLAWHPGCSLAYTAEYLRADGTRQEPSPESAGSAGPGEARAQRGLPVCDQEAGSCTGPAPDRDRGDPPLLKDGAAPPCAAHFYKRMLAC